MAARFNFAALALTLLASGSVALGARCLSPGVARCSWATLTGDAPHLDVPYLGTRPEAIRRMLDLAQLGPGDRVLDLGTGDGRILIAAAQRGGSGLGVDIDPVLIGEARKAAKRAGVATRTRFAAQDLFATPVDDFDVVTMFLLPEVNLRLRPRLLSRLEPGARIVSNSFDMGDWRADATARSGGTRLYMWKVPARVSGSWLVTDPAGHQARLSLHQHFQDVGGTLHLTGRTLPLLNARLDGARLRFTVPGHAALSFEGVADGNRITFQAPAGWQATRTSPSNGITQREPAPVAADDHSPQMPSSAR